jgi:hypothetical protein
MLTLHSYGHSGLTSTAYYVKGIADNGNKFAQAGAVSEVGFFLGLNTAPLGSNLPLRRIKAYSNANQLTRFDLLLAGTFQVVPSITGKRMNISPLDAAWKIYGLPAG